MIRYTLAILLVVLTGPPSLGQPPRDRFATELANAVFSAALDFIAPRALDPVTVQQLALWGLNGLTTLDPALATDLADGAVTLRRGNTVLLKRPVPPNDSADAWGTLVTEVAAAAWAASPVIQNGGDQVLIAAFFDDLFSHLDPYSRYVAPDAADEDRARRSGEAGAGLSLMLRRGRVLVQTVNADGPAAEAGIASGDQITAVDNQPTSGEDLDTVTSWITGLEGTEVVLTVRARTGRVRKVVIERAVLPPETVFGSRAAEIVTIRVTGFSSDTDQRFGRELERQIAQGGLASVKGIIIDLRGNRGGLLRQAVAATDLLMVKGVLATTAGRNPQAQHEWQASAESIGGGKPVAVLVDGRTASAAEIMAAALGDQGRAVVIGSSTLGKGLVQTISTLPDGGELFVSWSRVLAPSGWPIQGLGVLPQICTSLGPEHSAAELDALDHGKLLTLPALQRHNAARAPLQPNDIVDLRAACPAAEGQDGDLLAARFLFTHPAAYVAALLTPTP